MVELHVALLALALVTSGSPSGGDDDGDVRRGGAFTYQLAQVQRVEVGAGRTVVSAETNAPTPLGGYFALRVFIDNSVGPTQTISLSYRGNANQGLHVVTRSLEVSAGERRVVTMPVPSDMRYGTLVARGPGITEKGSAVVNFAGIYAPNRVMLSLGRPEAFEHFVGKAPSYSGSNVQVQAIAPGDAPLELASYVGYDAVVVPEEGGIDTLAEGQRRAIEAYAASGGTLIVSAPQRVGAAFPLLADFAEGSHRYGLGRLIISAPSNVSSATFNTDRGMLVNPQGPPPDWERRYGGTTWDVLLPQATAPLGKFMLIIGLFTLLIGPGSVWVARRKGPAALLVTIPGTALVTCALIVGYSLVADGFTVHGAVYGYTLLDRTSHRAITAGITAYYANLAPGRADYSASTALIAPYLDGRERYTADVEWKDGARFGSDFVPSRVYREWGVLSVEPTRARLVVKRKGNGYVVQNALGWKIEHVVVNLDGAFFSCEDVADGNERALVRSGPTATGLLGRAEGRFQGDVRRVIVDTPLKQGEFIASVGGQGFVPSGGIRVSLHEGESIVRGELEP